MLSALLIFGANYAKNYTVFIGNAMLYQKLGCFYWKMLHYAKNYAVLENPILCQQYFPKVAEIKVANGVNRTSTPLHARFNWTAIEHVLDVVGAKLYKVCSQKL